MQDDEMIYMFHAESIELLNDMEDSLLIIQDNGIDKENINAIFRAVHSIKGAAGMFELDMLVDFSHLAETLLDEIRTNKIEMNNGIITLFLKIKDHLLDLIDSIIENEAKENYSKQLLDKTLEYKKLIKSYLNGENPLENKNLNSKSEIISTTKDKESKQSFDQNTKQLGQSSTLKVESSKIDSLINLVGEMVITTASVMEHATRINDKDLNDSVHLLSRMLEELRETSIKTRMVPIGDTFSRYKRVVRDLSQELNKDIDLIIEGSETELDRTVIEKISDPLIHLIRNSIDHGIETIDERIKNGKGQKATLKLKAFHEASSITIQVIDDGKGLDRDKILQKALDQGLIDSIANIKNESIVNNLIMQPGFSTNTEVSNISGRGVGMDVVRRNIEELRGTIDIQSEYGKGMCVTIRLPLTLAIIDGFIITLAGDYYIIPLEMLLECIELTEDYKEFIKEHNFINLRDHVLPLLNLKEYFNYPVSSDSTKKENIVVVNFGTQKIGLIVDELLGEFQTVIKPMGKIFKNLKGIGGATILGDGRVSPILDIPVLLQYENQRKK